MKLEIVVENHYLTGPDLPPDIIQALPGLTLLAQTQYYTVYGGTFASLSEEQENLLNEHKLIKENILDYGWEGYRIPTDWQDGC